MSAPLLICLRRVCHLIALACLVVGISCGTPQSSGLAGDDGARAQRASAALLQRSGGDLTAAGKRFRFVGINRYDLAGGPQASKCYYNQDAQAMRTYRAKVMADAAAMGVTVVRLWAFQNFAGSTGKDFSAFDDVVAAAKKHNIRLVMTLDDQWDHCTLPDGANHFSKAASWYAGDYTRPTGYPLSYPDYLSALVTHFKDEPTIAMWQLMNEAESSDAGALQRFAKAMAARIKSIDKAHLVSVGTLACGQAGTDAQNYRQLHDDANIDVLEAHDYGNETTALSGCMATDIGVAKALGKPFFIGEAGINKSQGDDTKRSQLLAAKLQATAAQGVDGFTVWSYAPQIADSDGFSFDAASPMAAVLRRAASDDYASTMPRPSTPAPAPAAPAAPKNPAPAPAPAGSSRCQAKVALQDQVWSVGNGQYAGAVVISVTNPGDVAIAAPWTVKFSAPGYTKIDYVWNMTAPTGPATEVAGTANASWAVLQPHEDNSVQLGATIESRNQDVLPIAFSLNGQACDVVQP